MLIAIICLYIILIFPIFLSVNTLYYDENKHLYFSINIFGIKIISGYAEFIKSGIVLHYSKFKAKIFLYKNIFNTKKNVKPLMDYHIIKSNLFFDIGNKDNLVNTTLAVFLLNYFLNKIEWFLINKKPYIEFNHQINLYEETKINNFVSNNTIIFNLLMILISAIKMIMEKIINVIKNRKQQNKQSS